MSEPLSLELYFLLPPYLVKVQECRYCGESFKECDNIGRHLCHIHPGIRILSNSLTGTPQCVFYSCCGRSLQGRGCLQIDHTTCLFSERDAEKRLRDIQSFATTIVPHLLLRFITCPLPTSILYDTNKRTNKSIDRYFDARLNVLREVDLRTKNLLITHAPQFLDPGCSYTCYDYDDGDADADRTEIGVKTFDLIEEGHRLFLNSKESPLFNALKEASITKTRDQLLTVCDKAWRNRLGTPQDGDVTQEPGNALVTTNRCATTLEKIPFVIISRIHCKLDVFLK